MALTRREAAPRSIVTEPLGRPPARKRGSGMRNITNSLGRKSRLCVRIVSAKRCVFRLKAVFRYRITAPRSTIDAAKRKGRSRVSNGSAVFLDEVDGRSVVARRYRDVLADLVAHLGGNPTAAEMLIARRIATLAVLCEQAEADMASGKDVDVGAYATLANSLRRLVADVGLQPKMRDVTPTLSQYLAAKERQSA
jgi:hypothetical protein